MAKHSTRLTVPQFAALKGQRKIAMITAYDFPTGRLVDLAGVDAVLVGDSLAMVVQGHDSTLPATLDQMIYHAEMVARGVESALVVVDLPFPVNHFEPNRVIELAGRVLKETRAQAVKLEGGAELEATIRALVTAGIPVMAHVGLRPQSVHTLGGYRVQRDREKLIVDAQAAETAGAFGIVLECVTISIAESITNQLRIPTIGIGAGPNCDGQVLVLHDLLGMTQGRTPKFARAFSNVGEVIQSATANYISAVRNGQFPSSKESFDA